MNTTDHIDLFFKYFRRQLDTITNTGFAEGGEVYKKLLYCCLIDAVATVATQGSVSGHRVKFTTVVREHGKWPEHLKVSVPHLKALLIRTEDSSFDDVKALVANAGGFGKTIVPITEDLDFLVVDAKWPREPSRNGGQRSKKIDNVELAYLTHENLLYSLRNTLVHESRSHGTSSPLEWQENPYYHQVKSLDTGAESWSLNYPSAFLRKLAANIIDGTEAKCRAANLDPYSLFDYGDYWIGELNQP